MRAKLKGRSPYPFENIATAIAFSPNSKYLLAESILLCKRFNSRLFLIHVGEKDIEKEYQMQQLLLEFDTSGIDVQIVWREGEPVDVILQVCKENVVDLLVAGALKKEKLWNFYKGTVARNLCRKAKCSLLVLTQPSMHGTNFKHLVVNGVNHYKTPLTIETSYYFAAKSGVEKIDIIEEVDDSTLKTKVEDDLSCLKGKREREQIIKDQKTRMESAIQKSQLNIEVSFDCLFGKPGFTIGAYTEMKEADLLVMNSPSEKLGLLDRVFTRDLEFILNEMPSNLLLVHSRHEDKVKF